MNYQETTEYLFNSTPVFEKIGAKAYKPAFKPPMPWTNTSHIPIANTRPSILPEPMAKVPALIPLLPSCRVRDTR